LKRRYTTTRYKIVSQMTNTDQEKTVGPLPQERREMPLPGDPNTIYLAGLFVFGTLGAAYLASDIVLPLVIAFFLKLLLQPLVRTLENLYATRALASLLVIILLL
jgi:predicted PurR-regulated permease PerM